MWLILSNVNGHDYIGIRCQVLCSPKYYAAQRLYILGHVPEETYKDLRYGR